MTLSIGMMVDSRMRGVVQIVMDHRLHEICEVGDDNIAHRRGGSVSERFPGDYRLPGGCRCAPTLGMRLSR